MGDLTVLIIIAQFLLKEIMYDHLVKQKEERLLDKYAQTYQILNDSLKEAIRYADAQRMNEKLVEKMMCS